MFILKSRIADTISKARIQERNIMEKEYKYRLDKQLQEQKDTYELLLHEKSLEIITLNDIIDQNKAKMQEASEKEMRSKRIYLKAKEILSCVDFEFKRHLENNAKSMGQMDKIRSESENFFKQLTAKNQ
jgi:hypothetical protein